MLLYLPLAHNFGRLMHLLGAVRRLHDRVPPRPAARRRGAAAGAADACSRACRACTRRCTRPSVAQFDEATGAQAPADRLGARRRARGQRAAQAQGEPVPRGLALPSTGSPTGSSSRRCKERLGGRLRLPDLGRRAAREGDRRVLRRARHPDHRGLRPDRVHDRVRRRTARPLPLRHRRPAAARASSSRIAEDGELADPQRDRLRGLLQGPRGDGSRARRRRLAQARATSARSTRTASCTITDRKKDILVTAGGKNVAPQNIENDLKTSKFVSQALVVGDRRPYVAALITLDAGGDRQLGRGARHRRRRWPRWRATSASASCVQGVVDDVEPRALTLRADQAVRDPPARLHHGGGRGHADAQAEAPRRAGALRRRDRGALRRAVAAAAASAGRERG